MTSLQVACVDRVIENASEKDAKRWYKLAKKIYYRRKYAPFLELQRQVQHVTGYEWTIYECDCDCNESRKTLSLESQILDGNALTIECWIYSHEIELLKRRHGVYVDICDEYTFKSYNDLDSVATQNEAERDISHIAPQLKVPFLALFSSGKRHEIFDLLGSNKYSREQVKKVHKRMTWVED